MGLNSIHSIVNAERGRAPIPFEQWGDFADALGVPWNRWLAEMRVFHPQRVAALEQLFGAWLQIHYPGLSEKQAGYLAEFPNFIKCPGVLRVMFPNPLHREILGMLWREEAAIESYLALQS